MRCHRRTADKRSLPRPCLPNDLGCFIHGTETIRFVLHFPKMPLYYFDLEFDDDRALTDEGLWFPNLEQAEREAQGTAEEIIRNIGVPRVNVRIRDRHKRIQRKLVVSD
jgi:hypothetical protein